MLDMSMFDDVESKFSMVQPSFVFQPKTRKGNLMEACHSNVLCHKQF